MIFSYDYLIILTVPQIVSHVLKTSPGQKQSYVEQTHCILNYHSVQVLGSKNQHTANQ